METIDHWYDLAEAQAEVVVRLGLDMLTTTSGYDETARSQLNRVLDLDTLLTQAIESCPDEDGTSAWRIVASDEELAQLAVENQVPACIDD